MSDDETEQQEAEKETPWSERVSEHARFNLAIKLLAGLAAIVTIISGLSRVFGSNLNIPFYDYLGIISVIGSTVFIVAGLTLYFAVIRPHNRRLSAENASLKKSPTAAQNYRTIVEKITKIQELESDLSGLQKETEKYKALYETCLQSITDDNATYKKDLDDLSARHDAKIKLLVQAHERDIHTMGEMIDQHRWLIDRATKERLEFPHSVRVEKFDYTGLLEKMPGLCFMLEVRNNSVFDLVIAETVEGFLQYHGEKWTGTRITLRDDVGIAAGDVRDVGIQYTLAQADLDYFLTNQDNWKDGDEFCAFVTQNLRVMVRGAKEDYLITPQPLDLRDWRIYDRTKKKPTLEENLKMARQLLD